MSHTPAQKTQTFTQVESQGAKGRKSHLLKEDPITFNAKILPRCKTTLDSRGCRLNDNHGGSNPTHLATIKEAPPISKEDEQTTDLQSWAGNPWEEMMTNALDLFPSQTMMTQQLHLEQAMVRTTQGGFKTRCTELCNTLVRNNRGEEIQSLDPPLLHTQQNESSILPAEAQSAPPSPGTEPTCNLKTLSLTSPTTLQLLNGLKFEEEERMWELRLGRAAKPSPLNSDALVTVSKPNFAFPPVNLLAPSNVVGLFA